MRTKIYKNINNNAIDNKFKIRKREGREEKGRDIK